MRYAALLIMLLSSPLWGSEVIRVAAATNFKPTLQKLHQQFEAQTGLRVSLSSASTGVIANQLIHGAPFDIFFAADRETPEKLLTTMPGRATSTFCYAVGSLSLVGGDGGLEQLSVAESSLAIANPATAPYGRAAMEVLARAEFDAGKARKLVRGNNAIQAYQFWHSGAVDLALIPRSLAPDTGSAIPVDWHQPLAQYALVLNSGKAVTTYLNWIRSATVRSLIIKAGYQSCP